MANNMLGTKCTACGSGRPMPARTQPIGRKIVPDVIKVKVPKSQVQRGR